MNRYTAPVTVLIPRKGISVISVAGGPFHDPAADDSLFTALERELRDEIEVRWMDVEINDPAFAKACADSLLENLRDHSRNLAEKD